MHIPYIYTMYNLRLITKSMSNIIDHEGWVQSCLEKRENATF